MHRLMKKYALLGTIPFTLVGCGYFDSREAHRAQFEMVGMTGYDLQACAGTPNSSKKLNDSTEIWQYEISRTVPVPQDSTLIPIGGIIQLYQTFMGGAGSSCRMIVRMDHDRVSEIHYSGNNDEYIGTDGICSMITRGCARQRESTMHVAPGIWPLGPISAFHAARTPPQSTTATYSDQSGKYVPYLDDDQTKPVIRPAPPPETKTDTQSAK
ncbi:hypothetical protein GT348_03920 [Aristophania vespae]|uniref:Lipoprotein n=1 Tax=Aristophania vespae TaxID=2697033 RepID=A0A6P1NAV2_9PROT|nr:hypothetical protein [Aristophania vespae]QHI95526.1 hypothetical protein GT348_03920 [Aristophania vespae]